MLAEADPLPDAQAQAAVADGNRKRVAPQRRLHVARHVVGPLFCVAIGEIFGDQGIQHAVEVYQHVRIGVLLHRQRRRSVLNENGEQAGLRGSRQLKGRRVALVLVAVERRGKGSGRIRMTVIPDFKAKTILAFLIQNVSPHSTIYTDGLKSFEGLREAGFQHIARTQPLRSELRKGAKSAVPLADRAIGNLQQWLIGTYHGVSRAQLQVYLDEFVFRHNRRKQPAAAFQTLLGLGTGRKSTEYQRIRGARDLTDSG